MKIGLTGIRRALVASGLLLATGFGLAACDDEDTGGTKTAAGAAAPSVTVAGVTTREISSVYSFVGKVQAVDSIDIIPRVQGFLAKRNVADGAFVKQGELLFEVEPDQYEADLAAAKAAAAQKQAELALAEIELDRDTKLLKSNTIAQAQYDATLAKRNATQAQLEAANAQIDLAQLNLDYTTIHAPFDGRIGNIPVSVGDTVGPGVTLTRLVSLSPIDVAFSLSEGIYISLLEHLGTEAIGTRDSSTSPPVQLILPNRSQFSETGRVDFIDNAIDPATGTIGMRARFDNSDILLAPGIFVTVQIAQSTAQDHLVIPQAAVQRDQKGSFVLVVGAEGTVAQRYVDLGNPDGTDFIVNSGLQDGESVIVEGLQRVRPGVAVNAVEASPPPAGAEAAGDTEATGDTGDTAAPETAPAEGN